MKITIAKTAGFCFGVKRAIDITFDLARDIKEGIYTYGPLIHNPQVVSELEQKGVHASSDLYSPDIKTLIIRTHGVGPEVYAESLKKGYNVVDATCPFVQKAQNYAKALRDEGYQVLIIGDRLHPEVQGLIGFSGKDAIVAGNVKADGIQRIEKHGPFDISGEKNIMQSLDDLLHSFVDQQRMKVPGKTYTPCYHLNKR